MCYNGCRLLRSSSIWWSITRRNSQRSSTL